MSWEMVEWIGKLKININTTTKVILNWDNVEVEKRCCFVLGQGENPGFDNKQILNRKRKIEARFEN